MKLSAKNLLFFFSVLGLLAVTTQAESDAAGIGEDDVPRRRLGGRNVKKGVLTSTTTTLVSDHVEEEKGVLGDAGVLELLPKAETTTVVDDEPAFLRNTVGTRDLAKKVFREKKHWEKACENCISGCKGRKCYNKICIERWACNINFSKIKLDKEINPEMCKTMCTDMACSKTKKNKKNTDRGEYSCEECKVEFCGGK